jgi:ubiquinone biosynthesis protein
VPLIEIMYARRDGNDAYLAALEGWGYDVDKVIRNLDWNMLNQVYVFGYFHADLHPANIFVLPGNVIAYVDFGQVGQLPKRVRESLVTYTWLLFRGEVDAAIGELMRWFSPSTRTDAIAARRQLQRAHEAFLYSTASETPSRSMGASGRDEPGANPYSKLAVDIMRIIRANHLAMSQSIVAYLKMLVTLGTLRHQLAIDYDLSAVVRRFFERMMRRQLVEAVDPRRSIDRLYSATVQARRAIDLLEFVEDQEPLITFGVDSLFGIRRRMRSIRRRLVTLFTSILVVGVALYFLLADPRDADRMVGSDSTSILRTVLPLVIVGLVVALVFHVRQIGSDD